MAVVQEQFFDIGANLTHKSFEEDLDEVLRLLESIGPKVGLI